MRFGDIYKAARRAVGLDRQRELLLVKGVSHGQRGSGASAQWATTIRGVNGLDETKRVGVTGLMEVERGDLMVYRRGPLFGQGTKYDYLTAMDPHVVRIRKAGWEFAPNGPGFRWYKTAE
ncbi:MAG: hypothetical protein ABH864_05970 [archaeon]